MENSVKLCQVSIHAPRTERDYREDIFTLEAFVSIHAPRTERDRSIRFRAQSGSLFQSTRPVRSATDIDVRIKMLIGFQSTRPVRSATETISTAAATSIVSIHAPRTERDAAADHVKEGFSGFNPRAPYGARLMVRGVPIVLESFIPRAPYGARL